MKKQITPEIKQRIAALYYGQRIMQTTINNNPNNLSGIMMVEPLAFLAPDSQYFLNVVGLSSITDEDAIEVAKLVSGNKGWIGSAHYTALGSSVTLVKPNTTANVVVNISNDDGSIWDSSMSMGTLPGHDYLRSKGYALPAFGYSVEELVDAGVFNLKQ